MVAATPSAITITIANAMRPTIVGDFGFGRIDAGFVPETSAGVECAIPGADGTDPIGGRIPAGPLGGTAAGAGGLCSIGATIGIGAVAVCTTAGIGGEGAGSSSIFGGTTVGMSSGRRGFGAGLRIGRSIASV